MNTQTENQMRTKFKATMELLAEGEPVKYGDYEGFKTSGYIHNGGKYPESSKFHLSEKMGAGVYDITAVLDVVKGKPMARLEYTLNHVETEKAKKAS